MFDHSDKPRLFGVAPGIDFPKALVEGLRTRLKDQPPEAIAQVEVIVNTRRMARRLREIFDLGPPTLLPRIRTLSDLEPLARGIRLPRPVPPLRRRLELAQLVSQLLEADKTIAPRTSLYALSDSLADLIDEMQGEGVSASDIAKLDVSDLSGHWARSLQFLKIAQGYLDQMAGAPDAEARQRQLVLSIAAGWEQQPIETPVILAGSTGSRGTTSLLMKAVALLPQGALVLPGYDFDCPTHIWREMSSGTPQEDHPQYRFHTLMKEFDVHPNDIMSWSDHQPASKDRNALMSLSLRPAPVTDTWLSEGPNLQGINGATKGLTLLEAPTPRIEAIAIAMRLRKAVEDGQTAALITPDRMLTRQVTAALDRWNIIPDDSAGTPLHLSPPGRFLRHVAGLLTRKLDAEALLTLLKHPLTHSDVRRNSHQLFTQQLELQIRKAGLPFPTKESLLRVATLATEEMEDAADFLAWAKWVSDTFCEKEATDHRALSDWVTQFHDLSERIAAGQDNATSHELWKKQAGQTARQVIENLHTNGIHGGEMSAKDFADLINALLAAEEVRDRDAPHPNVMIWGTLEARVQGADLVILGGLNDGSWPEAPPPDPWLNRRMRLDAGLLLPERRIGLSAHDYQQAVAAPEVWLSRAIRSDEAETVPSRWLNRLENLLKGLPSGEGKIAWGEMRSRGQQWLSKVAALETVVPLTSSRRPSPRPPLDARPRALSVTEIKRLIRDPYAIYAKHVLRLRPINPLVQPPDAPMRGIVLHQIMEHFIKGVQADPSKLNRTYLLEVTDLVLDEEAPWPAARAIWRARVERIAEWFIRNELQRQAVAKPILFEETAKGVHLFEDLGFTLTGYADRIDRKEDGSAVVYDYKTGTPPSKKEQKFFDKQLLIEAAMIQEGAFADVGHSLVSDAVFIGLGSNPVEIQAPLIEEPPEAVMAGLRSLITSYLDVSQGFTSRRMIRIEHDAGDYDQLARFGEWDGTDAPDPVDLQ